MLRYKDYKLIQPNHDQVNRINEIIKNQNGSIFHEVELNRIVENTFQTQLFYLVDNLYNISCVSPVHVTNNGYGLRRYHFKPLYDIPYAGFVGNENLEIKNLSVGLFESLKYEGFPYKNVVNHKFKKLRHGETTMVDLTKSEDEIFNKIIHSKRRNMIRKAMKVGVTVKKYSNLQGLLKFYKILEPLHQKMGFNKSMNLEYYKEIFNIYSNKNQAFILLAFKEEKLISGVLILGNENYMHYYKGASIFGVKNEGQGELLQWEAIKTSKSLGTKYYDLCNLNKDKLPAIYRFKTGISNNIVKYPIYSKNNLGYKVLNKFTNNFG